jgi:hypothetical protein
MRNLRYTTASVLFAAYVSLVVFVVRNRPGVLLSGLGKLIVVLVLACLLAFVVLHSAEIRRIVIACLRSIPSRLFSDAGLDTSFARFVTKRISVSRAPYRVSRFQRPPPVSSL